MKTHFTSLKIMTGSDLSRRRLPMIQAAADIPGPVVWLTAAGHGDEVGGIVVIQEVFKALKKINLEMGSLYAFPLMNPIGFETVSRRIPYSKEDLNRSFPGDKNGSLGERIAGKILETILSTRPSLVLDLHNDWIKSVPYALIEPDPGDGFNEVYEKIICFARQTGLLIVRDGDLIPSSLSHCLMIRRIPSLTLEMGESYVVNEENIKTGFHSVMKILENFGMIKAIPENRSSLTKANPDGLIYEYSDRPLSTTSGIIRFHSSPGDFVKKGSVFAKIYNAFGKHQESLTAVNDAVVLGHADSAVAYPGGPVSAFGTMGLVGTH